MTLKKAIETKNVKEIRHIAANKPSSLVADLLEQLEDKERLIFFRLLDKKLQSELFSALEDDYQENLIKLFTNEDMKDVLQDLYADEIADLIEEVPRKIALRILRNTPKKRLNDVKRILRYADHVVGSFMTVELLALKRSQTVGQALEMIKTKRREIFIENFIFVTDAQGVLVGYVTIDDILFSRDDKNIKRLYKPCSFVFTTTHTNEAIRVFADNDMSVLPVLDSNKKLVGLISSDDMIDVVQESADENIQKMAGIGYDDTPYSRSSTKKIFKSRILWLMLLMISSTISQIVLDAFQNIAANNLDNVSVGLSSAIWTTALVAILPVISGAAGNAGSQSSTTIIRALATGDIKTKDYLKVLWKELKVSFWIGLVLGIANFLRLIIYYAAKGELGHTQASDYIFLSLAASISLFVVIVLAKVAGGMLPLLAKTFHLDPAVMAAPLLTTLIDALSTMIFFGISIGIMIMVL